MHYIFIFFFFAVLDHVNASGINSFASACKFNIKPLITINEKHIWHFEVYKNNGGQPILLGLHHDPHRNFEKRKLVSYCNVVPGPKGSFGADVIFRGVNYGFKTLFPPHWHYEKVAFLIIALCVRRYRNMTFEEYCGTKKRDTFEDTIKGLLVRVVFDKEKYRVISAYPVISRPTNSDVKSD
jgi:hypothetical protein